VAQKSSKKVPHTHSTRSIKTTTRTPSKHSTLLFNIENNPTKNNKHITQHSNFSTTPPKPSKGAKSVMSNPNGPVKQKASGVDYEFALPPSPHPNYEVVIGLETHAQISSKSKMFSSASTQFKASPNENTSLFDAAVPGTLPRVNEDCVNKTILTGLALGGKVNQTSYFHRKQYFYCDMPTGYQITQNFPVITGGELSLDSLLPAGMKRSVGISHIQIEHDSGKSIHDVNPHQTHVDLNRAGVALMEIVTTPTIYSAHEAVLYLKKLQSLLRVLGTSNANLEEGSMRCDVNVTVRRLEPRGEMSQRVEIKNMNSFKHILYAIQSEATRQIEILEEEYRKDINLKSVESSIQRETRGYDHKNDQTYRLRSKENLLDYRFYPEPDLPPLIISHQQIQKLKSKIPILPDIQFKYLFEKMLLTQKESNVIIQEEGAFDYFLSVLTTPTNIPGVDVNSIEIQQIPSLEEYDYSLTGFKHPSYTTQTLPLHRSTKNSHNWLTNELFGRIKRHREGNLDGSTTRHAPLLETNRITPLQLAEIIDLVNAEHISGKQAKVLLDTLFNKANGIDSGDETDEDTVPVDFSTISPHELAKELNLLMDNDPVRISGLVDVVVGLYPAEVEQFITKDKKSHFGFLTGQIIKLSQHQEGLGEANPKEITKILTDKLAMIKANQGQGV
jgi:aspartyl-tRNA(Asn)/glutamyl-tRNA(Gln) amidotransferase subunit B